MSAPAGGAVARALVSALAAALAVTLPAPAAAALNVSVASTGGRRRSRSSSRRLAQRATLSVGAEYAYAVTGFGPGAAGFAAAHQGAAAVGSAFTGDGRSGATAAAAALAAAGLTAAAVSLASPPAPAAVVTVQLLASPDVTAASANLSVALASPSLATSLAASGLLGVAVAPASFSVAAVVQPPPAPPPAAPLAVTPAASGRRAAAVIGATAAAGVAFCTTAAVLLQRQRRSQLRRATYVEKPPHDATAEEARQTLADPKFAARVERRQQATVRPHDGGRGFTRRELLAELADSAPSKEIRPAYPQVDGLQRSQTFPRAPPQPDKAEQQLQEALRLAEKRAKRSKSQTPKAAQCSQAPPPELEAVHATPALAPRAFPACSELTPASLRNVHVAGRVVTPLSAQLRSRVAELAAVSAAAKKARQSRNADV